MAPDQKIFINEQGQGAVRTVSGEVKFLPLEEIRRLYKDQPGVITALSSEDLAAERERESAGGVGSMASTALMSGLGTASMGLISPEDFAKGGGPSLERQRMMREENPVTSAVSGVAGAVLPALVPGGQFTPAGALARGAVSAGKSVKGALGAGAIGRASGASAGLALEGAGYGMADYVTETSLAEKPFDLGEALRASAVAGAFSVGGGAVGVGLGRAARYAGKKISTAAEKLSSKGAGKASSKTEAKLAGYRKRFESATEPDFVPGTRSLGTADDLHEFQVRPGAKVPEWDDITAEGFQGYASAVAERKVLKKEIEQLLGGKNRRTTKAEREAYRAARASAKVRGDALPKARRKVYERGRVMMNEQGEYIPTEFGTVEDAYRATYVDARLTKINQAVKKAEYLKGIGDEVEDGGKFGGLFQENMKAAVVRAAIGGGSMGPVGAALSVAAPYVLNPGMAGRVISKASKGLSKLDDSFTAIFGGRMAGSVSAKTIPPLLPNDWVGISEDIDSQFPGHLASEIRESAPPGIPEDVVERVATREAKALSFLQERLPRPPQGISTEEWTPTTTELERFRRYLKAVGNRQSVIEDYVNGELTVEGVEVLEELEKDGLRAMQSMVYDMHMVAKSKGKKFDPREVMQLSILTQGRIPPPRMFTSRAISGFRGMWDHSSKRKASTGGNVSQGPPQSSALDRVLSGAGRRY